MSANRGQDLSQKHISDQVGLEAVKTAFFQQSKATSGAFFGTIEVLRIFCGWEITCDLRIETENTGLKIIYSLAYSIFEYKDNRMFHLQTFQLFCTENQE